MTDQGCLVPIVAVGLLQLVAERVPGTIRDLALSDAQGGHNRLEDHLPEVVVTHLLEALKKGHRVLL